MIIDEKRKEVRKKKKKKRIKKKIPYVGHYLHWTCPNYLKQASSGAGKEKFGYEG